MSPSLYTVAMIDASAKVQRGARKTTMMFRLLLTCAVLATQPLVAAAQDDSTQDFTAEDARQARRDGVIASLETVRRNIREQYDVVQFYNTRLLADESGSPTLYCVPIETVGGTILMIQVDPLSGDVLANQERRARDPENPCLQNAERTNASSGR